MEPVWAIGLMTGTVLDGMIDIAAIRTDGQTISAFGPWTLAPYPANIRPLLAQALQQARQWQFTGPEPAVFAQAEAALTRAQSGAVLSFLNSSGIRAADIGAIGFHGQTVLHRPPQPGRPGQTRQLGDGALMAALTATPVVYDFRAADMRAGGQGAPLCAAYHGALLRRLPGSSAVLNLGGVANLTWQGADGTLAAFDTGPANAPLNDWVERATGRMMDENGAFARAGRVDEARLARLLDHPYFAAPYPKSLDRYGFTAAMADGLSLEDGAALLTAFTATAVGRGLDILPQRPVQIIVCGGGRKNPALMDAIRVRGRVEPILADDCGWRGDAIEAECFAFLAVRRLRGLACSFPSTTGASSPIVGGRVAGA